MAIQRCPYCKAIIDEDLEYCSNCGTRLLFPEDEFIEEEIPGEKIVDEEMKTEEPESKKSEKPKRKRKKRKKKEKEVSVLKEKEETAEIESGESKKGEEPIEDEEKTEELYQAEIEEESDELANLEQEVELQEKPAEKSETEEGIQDEKEIEEEILEPVEEDLSGEEEKSQEIDFAVEEEGIENNTDKSEEVDFKTADLKKIVDTAENEREDIEKFLDSLREERKQHKEREESNEDKENELPPWAENIKEAPPSDIPVSQKEEEKEELLEPEEGVSHVEEEEHLEPGEASNTEEETGLEDVQAVDTGVGIPEKIDQQGLPFEGHYEEEEKAGMVIPRKERKTSRFTIWLKSSLFDVFFVALLWFVTLWIASHVIGVSVFQLISSSTWESIGFLAALLAVYFFLFLFFLGETIGSYLFSWGE